MKQRLAAFSISPTSIACAIFSGVGLEAWQTKPLNSDTQAAYKTITAFIHEVIRCCGITSAAIESTNANPTRDPHAALLRCAAGLLQAKGMPVVAVHDKTLLEAYKYPAVEDRSGLRGIMSEMFPQFTNLACSEELLDAAALGLYVQTELLLEGAEPQTSNNILP